MGAPFTDITLYTPIPYEVGTPEYWEEISLQNFISDLYVQKMKGYKPPKTTRITIQPAFHDVWKRTWKFGSIISIAPYYNHDEYMDLDKKGKYKYILDLIQSATMQLAEEYDWDKTVFENAYQNIIENEFKFKVDYPAKKSKDKKKEAVLSIEKTEKITSVYVSIESNNSTLTKKLFDKKNAWWYDCTYILARHAKWFDNNRFGIRYKKGILDIVYSLEKDEVVNIENGEIVKEINLKNYFMLG